MGRKAERIQSAYQKMLCSKNLDTGKAEMTTNLRKQEGKADEL